MSTRTWKIAVIVIAILIVATLEFDQNFHGYEKEGSTYQGGGTANGTLLIVESLPTVSVKVGVSFAFSGESNGPGKIVLENGRTYAVNSSNPEVHIVRTINGSLFSPSIAGNFEFGVNLSSSSPAGIAVVRDFSFALFNQTYLESLLDGINYVAFYVWNSSNFVISAVVMPL